MDASSKTVIEFINALIEKWSITEIPVVQSGKRRYLPLVKIEDQRIVLRYVTDKLHEYRQTLKAGPAEGQTAEVGE